MNDYCKQTNHEKKSTWWQRNVVSNTKCMGIFFLFAMKNKKTTSIIYCKNNILLCKISTEFLQQIISCFLFPFRYLVFVFIYLIFFLVVLFCHIKLNTNYIRQKKPCWEVVEIATIRSPPHAYVHEGELILFNSEHTLWTECHRTFCQITNDCFTVF